MVQFTQGQAIRSLIFGFGLTSIGILGGCSTDIESPATQEAILQEEQMQVELSSESNDAAASQAGRGPSLSN